MNMEGAMTISATLFTGVAQLNNPGKATALALTPAPECLQISSYLGPNTRTYKAIFVECT